MADVAPVERTFEPNPPRRVVGAVASDAEIVAERTDRQHASSGADDVAVLLARAGVEYLHVFADCGIEPGDRIAVSHLAGVSMRRDDDADRRPRVPAHAPSGEIALERREHELGEIGFEPEHD